MTRPPALTDPDEHTRHTRHTGDIRDTPDPWERYGWIMGAIWLVFLMFSLTSAFTVETSLVWRSLAIAAILAFAAVYVYGFIQMGRRPRAGTARYAASGDRWADGTGG